MRMGCVGLYYGPLALPLGPSVDELVELVESAGAGRATAARAPQSVWEPVLARCCSAARCPLQNPPDPRRNPGGEHITYTQAPPVKATSVAHLPEQPPCSRHPPPFPPAAKLPVTKATPPPDPSRSHLPPA